MAPPAARPRLAGPPGRLLFAVAALPVLVRAAARVDRLLRRVPLEELPVRLRDVPPFAASWLRRPADLDAVLARLLPLLPPRRTGRCLKRSLVLLDLWSRCGLAPRLHVGVRRPGEGTLEAHAWVTTGAPELDRRSGPAGHRELWSA
ncbi:MAG TPA: lasso peptide biosynthesis B2 protein [Thermoanaerobaculia bacterium]|nr:lasso peptide biosynthesis B2 protein [Thermoanaerobaculia bacterium]